LEIHIVVKKRIRKTFIFDGRRYYVDGSTQADAIAKCALRRKELEDGARRISRNMSVAEWSAEYLDTYRLVSVSKKTYTNLKSLNRRWVLPNIGNLQLRSVKPLHCQSIMNSMAGLSGTHVKRTKQHIFDMFEKARINDLLVENPAAHLNIPNHTNGSHRSITDGERSALIAVCETNPYGLWVLMMLYCGLRPAETSLIQGKDIDLANRILHIPGTKTAAANRDVPIPETFASILSGNTIGVFDYLFTNRDGRPINETNRRRMWASIKKDLHITLGGNVDYGELKRILPPYVVASDLVPYCLRHTYCTDLQAAGVPINVAKELMGHSSISMTANIYTHSSPQSFESAKELINLLHKTQSL
jgi:integrase